MIDIMEALKRSLENAKKPVRTATGKAAVIEETAAPAKSKKAKKVNYNPQTAMGRLGVSRINFFRILLIHRHSQLY